MRRYRDANPIFTDQSDRSGATLEKNGQGVLTPARHGGRRALAGPKSGKRQKLGGGGKIRRWSVAVADGRRMTRKERKDDSGTRMGRCGLGTRTASVSPEVSPAQVPEYFLTQRPSHSIPSSSTVDTSQASYGFSKGCQASDRSVQISCLTGIWADRVAKTAPPHHRIQEP